MCVIAGYMGSRPAAPILLDMLQREEGLAGGFYSGIATVADGELFMEKVVGDVATLTCETEARQLRGTAGIAHSRTPSGGGREWAHPFVDTTGKMAYIANGAVGKFNNLDQLAALSRQLMAEGHRFYSQQQEPVPGYPVLADGLSVHFSDTLCQAIAAAYEQSAGAADRLLQAAWRIYQEVPGELVGLCLHAAHPDEIVAMRHNKPLEIGRDEEGGVYLASTTLAFPAGVQSLMRMPAGAAAAFRRDGSVQLLPFHKSTFQVGEFPSPFALETRLSYVLRGSEAPTIEKLCDAAKTLWPDDVLDEKEIAVFEMLAALLAEGRIRLENEQVPGMFGKGTVPRTRVHWQWPHHAKSRFIQQKQYDVTVRGATYSDIPAITCIAATAFAPVSIDRISEEYFGEPLGGRNWSVYKSESVIDAARQRIDDFIVAEIEGAVVGYASVMLDETRGLATVGNNAVLPEYQGRGVGSALQQEIIRRFRARGYSRWKVTTMAHDYPAQRLYEKMGFTEVSRSVVYLHQDKMEDEAES